MSLAGSDGCGSHAGRVFTFGEWITGSLLVLGYENVVGARKALTTARIKSRTATVACILLVLRV
jgi:hypothetical protein